MKKLFIALLMITVPLTAQTLAKIDLLSQGGNGYFLATTTGTTQLVPLCTYTNGSQDNCSGVSLTWGSQDTTSMSVNSSTGLATGLGTSTINAEVYAYNGHITGHHGVTLNMSSFGPSINILPANYNTVIVGTTVLLSAASNNNFVLCGWSSSNPSVATVDSYGNVKGIAAGSAVITCTLNTYTGTVTINVVAPTQALNTYWVRPNGAPRNNSITPGATIFADGLTDVDCPTSGSGVMHCAFNDPMWLFTDNSGSGSYTGAVQSGDTAIIRAITPQPPGTPSAWPMICFGVGDGCWNTFLGFGKVQVPSGTPAHHTKILGENFASCSKNSDSVSNRTKLWGRNTTVVFDLRGQQNIDMGCIDLGSYQDCQSLQLATGAFTCPVPANFPLIDNDLSANINFTDMKVHGFQTAISGTQGPGFTFTDFQAMDNFLDGLNFDDPFGVGNQQADGMVASYLDALESGSTEEQPKVLSGVSRDSSGNITVSFASSAAVNYIVGNNITLAGNTPSDLNGTFPVSAITFNQQTTTITGGSCTNISGSIMTQCAFTTSVAPTFTMANPFVLIAGATPSYLNGTWEVYSWDNTGFIVQASPVTRIGWAVGTISAGGTAAVATSLTATGTGGAETATVTGTAGHVSQQHRAFDQADGGASNGDGIGAGDGTTGTWSCDRCRLIDNLQDGYDMLHAGLYSTSFTNSFASGNEGAGVKVGNADYLTYTNDVVIANCESLIAFNPNKAPDFNQYLGMPCRAGSAYGVTTRPWSQSVMSNISAMTPFDNYIGYTCVDPIGCQALPSVITSIAQNLEFVGYLDTNVASYNGQYPAIEFAQGSTPAVWTWLNNSDYQSRNEPWSDPSNKTNVNPLIVHQIPNISSFAGETAALTFNMNLTGSSPLIGAGLHNTYTPTNDYNGQVRSNPPAIGAYEFQGATPQFTGFSGNVTLKGNVTIR